MRPSELAIGHYLKSEIQVQIPNYQRPYEWTLERWRALWRDISQQYRSLEKNPKHPAHFMGATIVAPESGPEGTAIQSYSVIDGQQRLLTLFIVSAAFRDHQHYIADRAVPLENSLNTISPEFSKSAPRILPKQADQEAVGAILQGDLLREIPAHLYEANAIKAYRFFRFQFWRGLEATLDATIPEPPRPSKKVGAEPAGSYLPWGEPARDNDQINPVVFSGTVNNGLKVLEIQLQPEDEDRSVIFETMNSKGTPLKQFDLARNSLFVRLPDGGAKFHREEWEPAEKLVRDVTYASLRDDPHEQFFYEYMISLGNKASKADVHALWLDQAVDDVGYGVTPQSEEKFLRFYARPFTYSAALYPIAVGQRRSVFFGGRDLAVESQHQDMMKEIMAMSGGPAVPLVLRAVRSYMLGEQSGDQLSEILATIQSFLVRYLLSGEGLSPLRSHFIKMAMALKSDAVTPENLKKILTVNGWKTNDSVLGSIKTVLFTSMSSQYFPILRGIEKQLSGAGAHPMPFGNGREQYSVEHIYPQSASIGKAWQEYLVDSDLDRASMDARRYMLGNLTAVSNYDNKINARKSFNEKRKLIGQVAPLRLHELINSADVWSPEVIDARTTWMAEVALERWPGPSPEDLKIVGQLKSEETDDEPDSDSESDDL